MLKMAGGWCGEADTDWIQLRIGGRQGTTEMPLLWECVVGYVIGRLIETCRSHGRGVAIPSIAVGADLGGHSQTTSLHAIARAGVLDHAI